MLGGAQRPLVMTSTNPAMSMMLSQRSRPPPGISPLVDPRSVRHIGDTIERVKRRNQGEFIIRVVILISVIAVVIQLVMHHGEKRAKERELKERTRERELVQGGGSFAARHLTFM